MKRTSIALLAALFALLPLCSPAADKASGSPLDKLKLVKGPAKADMNGIAQVDVPAGYFFTGTKGAQTILEMMGNIKTGEEVGFLSPTSMVWFVVFEFDATGYVKDDDKDKLDADAMLQTITRGTERANTMRASRGEPPLHIVGWEQPPHYNSDTHNLEWAIKGESEGKPVLNYNTRMLGRKGVMRLTLVGDPESLAAARPDYNKVIATYAFQPGQRYAEFRSGDKVAKYGLAALVVGGAAVGAAKLGLFAWAAVFLKKAWKLVVVAVAACAAAVKKFFAKIFGKEPTYGPTST